MQWARHVWFRSFQQTIDARKGLVFPSPSPSPSSSSSSSSSTFGDLRGHHFHVSRRVIPGVTEDNRALHIDRCNGQIVNTWAGPMFLSRRTMQTQRSSEASSLETTSSTNVEDQSHRVRYIDRLLADTPRQKRQPIINLVPLGVKSAKTGNFSNALSLAWTTRFALISSRFDPKSSRRVPPAKLPDPIWPEAKNHPNMRMIWESKDIPIEEIVQSWFRKRSVVRAMLWPDFMLWVMHHRPERALEVLDATYERPLPPMALLADCLDFVTRYHLQGVVQAPRTVLIRLYRLIFHLILEKDARQPILHSKTLRLLFKHFNKYGKKRLYDGLVQRNVEIHPRTKLLIIQSLAKSSLFGRAMAMLDTVVQSGETVGSPHFMKTCTSLLHYSGEARHPDVDGMDSTAILTRLLDYGIRPNLHNYNAVIRNVMKVGHYPMGWRMYEAMKADGMQPDLYTYSIMLNAAKKRRDWGRVDRIIRELQETGTKPDGYIVTDLLQVTQLYMNTRYNQSGFDRMLARFQDYYSDEFLRQLGILPANASHRLHIVRPDPPPPTVTILLSAYLSYCTDWTVVTVLYLKYRTQVAAHYHNLGTGEASTYILNSFLLYFTKSRQALHYCNAILDDMLNPATGLGKPTIFTWTIMLNGYVYVNELQQAEEILELMRENGERPNQVTWNSIIMGYAKVQDVKRAVKAVMRMKAHGLEGDEWTTAALGKIQDREELIKQLRIAEEGDEIAKMEDAGMKVISKSGPFGDDDFEDEEDEKLWKKLVIDGQADEDEDKSESESEEEERPSLAGIELRASTRSMQIQRKRAMMEIPQQTTQSNAGYNWSSHPRIPARRKKAYLLYRFSHRKDS